MCGKKSSVLKVQFGWFDTFFSAVHILNIIYGVNKIDCVFWVSSFGVAFKSMCSFNKWEQEKHSSIQVYLRVAQIRMSTQSL